MALGRGDEEDYERLVRDVGGLEPGCGRNGGGDAARGARRAVVGLLPGAGIERIVTTMVRARLMRMRVIVRTGRRSVLMMRERPAQVDARSGVALQGHGEPEQQHEQQAFERSPHEGANDGEIFDLRQRNRSCRCLSIPPHCKGIWHFGTQRP